MRTDYPVCPSCQQGRLVPLMFGPGRCDLACENATSKADLLWTFDELARRGVSYDKFRGLSAERLLELLKAPAAQPTIFSGSLRVQQHATNNTRRYTFYFTIPQKQFFWNNVRN